MSEFIGKEIQTAYLESYSSEYGQNIFDRYVTLPTTGFQDQEFRDPDTGETLTAAPLNAELERSKTRRDANPKDFRNEIVNFAARARQQRRQEPHLDQLRKLRTVIEKRCSRIHRDCCR